LAGVWAARLMLFWEPLVARFGSPYEGGTCRAVLRLRHLGTRLFAERNYSLVYPDRGVDIANGFLCIDALLEQLCRCQCLKPQRKQQHSDQSRGPKAKHGSIPSHIRLASRLADAGSLLNECT
jgi:hypothetical protein